MELSEYMLETLREDGEFILVSGPAPAPDRRESTVYSRGDTCLGTPRTGKPQEDGARILLKGRARSRVGRSASRARTAPGADDARTHRPWRRASGSTAWKTDGIGAVFAPGHRPVGCARPATRAGPDPQGHQACQCAGQLCDRPGMADGLWYRVAPSTRAPVARTSRVHRGDTRLHGTRTDRTNESFDRFPERPLCPRRHAV